MIDFKIYSGQLVRIKINNVTYLLGVCTGNNRNRNADNVSYQYTIGSLKKLMPKNNLDTTFAADTDTIDIVRACIFSEMGISEGFIDEDNMGVIDEAWNTEGRELNSILDTIAQKEGMQWWLDDEMKLYFAENEEVISDAPYDLDKDFGSFDDYRDLNISEDLSNYANWTETIGKDHNGVTLKGFHYSIEEYDEFLNICGYDSSSVSVVNDNNIYFYPDINICDAGTLTNYIVDVVGTPPEPTFEQGDFIYNRTRDAYSFISTVSIATTATSEFYISPPITGQTSGDKIWYQNGLNKTMRRMLRSKTGYPPSIATFTTRTPGFLPKQKLYINQMDLDIEAYFAITQVNVRDEGSGSFEFTITAEKKLVDDFNSITERDFIRFFNKF